jgi:hypothetical protein
MKKLSQPTEPRQIVTSNPHVLDLGDVSEVTETVPSSNLPKRVLDYDLKKMKSFREIRKNYKAKSQKNVFVNDLSVLLDQYPHADHQLDTDLLVHVLNIAESFFVFGDKEEREKAKSEAVTHLMKKYFRDDADVLDIMMTSVFPRVKKSTMLRRMWRRMKLYFKKDPNQM